MLTPSGCHPGRAATAWGPSVVPSQHRIVLGGGRSTPRSLRLWELTARGITAEAPQQHLKTRMLKTRARKATGFSQQCPLGLIQDSATQFWSWGAEDGSGPHAGGWYPGPSHHLWPPHSIPDPMPERGGATGPMWGTLTLYQHPWDIPRH